MTSIQFHTGDHLGSDHLRTHRNLSRYPLPPPPPPHIGTHLLTTPSTNLTRLTEKYSNQHSGSADFSGHLSTSDLDTYADFIVTAISTAVDKAIPKSRSVRCESNPISDDTIALIKEKRRLTRQYSQNKDPPIKTCVNQLQKQVMEELNPRT